MKISEFKEKYRIEATALGYQEIRLPNDDNLEVEYGVIDEIIGTTEFVVLDDSGVVFRYEGDDEDEFIDKLVEEFNIEY